MTNAEKRNYVLSSEDCDYIEKLILKNEAIVRAVIRSALGEKFDQIGEDCISELYLLACTKIDLLKKHENPVGWLVVASRNITLNALRKHNTRLSRASDEEISHIRAKDNVFESALYNIWLKDGAIDKLLATLTPHEKEIYDYLYRKRLPAKKVAEIMGLSDSTIRNINAGIRKKIKDGMSDNDL